MAASTIKICSRKKWKANGPSELEKILLGYYIRLGPRNQGSHIYLGIKRLRRGKQVNRNFGIKSFLSQNWGACVYTKIWEKNAGTQRLPRLCQSRNRLHEDRYQLIQMRHWNWLSLNDVSR